MKQFIFVVAIAFLSSTPALAAAVAQDSQVQNVHSSAANAMSSPAHHEPLIKITYVLLPPAPSAPPAADAASLSRLDVPGQLPGSTYLLDGGKNGDANIYRCVVLGRSINC